MPVPSFGNDAISIWPANYTAAATETDNLGRPVPPAAQFLMAPPPPPATRRVPFTYFEWAKDRLAVTRYLGVENT